MKTQLMSEQESFWSGTFGTEYSLRNQESSMLANNIALFSKIMSRMCGIKSIIEYGANIGLNLKALKLLFPSLEFTAVEINRDAVKELRKNTWLEVHHQSIIEFTPKQKYDFVFVKGVLIHIHPEALDVVYNLLFKSTSRYIMIAEYYHPTPVFVDYRGHKNKLFKRDFCGEMLDKFKDLQLIDYGFCYHRDTFFPQDDINWFLLEKKNLC